MKIKSFVVLGIISVIIFGILYFYLIENGFSIYDQGLSLIYFSDTPPEQRRSNAHYWEFEIKKITEKDISEMTELKTMLELALSQEFPLQSSGFTEIVDFNSYRIIRDGDDIRIQNYMSSPEVSKYQKWISENLPSNFFEYKGKIFGINSWST